MRLDIARGAAFSGGPGHLTNGPSELLWNDLTEPLFDPAPRYG